MTPRSPIEQRGFKTQKAQASSYSEYIGDTENRIINVTVDNN